MCLPNVPRQLSPQNSKTPKVRGEKSGAVETAPSVEGAGISCTSPLDFISSPWVGEGLDDQNIKELFEYKDQSKAPQITVNRILQYEKHPTDKNKLVATVQTMTGPRGLVSLFFGPHAHAQAQALVG